MLSGLVMLAFSTMLAVSPLAQQAPPSSLSSTELAERTTYRRAVEAAIWGMPIVAMDAIRQGFLRDMGARLNDIVFYSKPADWKFQTTTPNASTHYIYSAYDTRRDGPIVLEVPPVIGAGLYGQLCDMWDVPLAITGPGGDDKGEGGKYLLLPPDYRGTIPAGYIPVRQQTYSGYWLMRTIPKSKSDADNAAAITLLKKIRMYPLSSADKPPEQRFIDASGKLWDGIPRMDESFYAVLAKMVNEEPVLPRDLAMMNMLRSIGIEKGRAFKPDPAANAVLKRAIGEAKGFFQDLQRSALKPYWDGEHWGLPDLSGVKTEFSYQTADMLDVDYRGMGGFFFWAPPKKSDASAPTIYVNAIVDGDGESFTGDRTYRLKVPANVPAKQYWSATVYDWDTASFIREASVISLDSYNAKTIKNSDGSIDIYFAPQAPAGEENNWVTTVKGGKWFIIFRLYGPDKAFFDKTWKMPDIQKVN
jgi:hypothetical protein